MEHIGESDAEHCLRFPSDSNAPLDLQVKPSLYSSPRPKLRFNMWGSYWIFEESLRRHILLPPGFHVKHMIRPMMQLTHWRRVDSLLLRPWPRRLMAAIQTGMWILAHPRGICYLPRRYDRPPRSSISNPSRSPVSFSNITHYRAWLLYSLTISSQLYVLSNLSFYIPRHGHISYHI